MLWIEWWDIPRHGITFRNNDYFLACLSATALEDRNSTAGSGVGQGDDRRRTNNKRARDERKKMDGYSPSSPLPPLEDISEFVDVLFDDDLKLTTSDFERYNSDKGGDLPNSGLQQLQLNGEQQFQAQLDSLTKDLKVDLIEPIPTTEPPKETTTVKEHGGKRPDEAKRKKQVAKAVRKYRNRKKVRCLWFRLCWLLIIELYVVGRIKLFEGKSHSTARKIVESARRLRVTVGETRHVLGGSGRFWN